MVGTQGVQQILEKDYVGGFSNLLDAGSNLFMMSRLKACFVAGTPILTPDGWKTVEDVVVGERVLSRDENDPAREVRSKAVLATFVRVSPVLNVHVGGKQIGTTGEHPFYVDGKGWVEARSLRIGDLLVGRSEEKIPVEGNAESGRIELVYNFEVEDDHTYFVGKEEWGWDVWVHNASYSKAATSSPKPQKRIHITYTKVNMQTGEIYSGRTSGYGTPGQVLKARDRGHHMNSEGFEAAVLDKVSTNRKAIRGREQQLINYYGGAKSMGGTSGNPINGIHESNPNRKVYLKAASRTFGAI